MNRQNFFSTLAAAALGACTRFYPVPAPAVFDAADLVFDAIGIGNSDSPMVVDHVIYKAIDPVPMKNGDRFTLHWNREGHLWLTDTEDH